MINPISKTLMMLAADYPEVVALSADLTPTARLVEFKETYPDRFFDVGIAEQHGVTFAAGMMEFVSISATMARPVWMSVSSPRLMAYLACSMATGPASQIMAAIFLHSSSRSF